MKTVVSLIALAIAAAALTPSHARADVSRTCEQQIRKEGYALVLPAGQDEIAEVTAQLAKKLQVSAKRLTLQGSATFGDGAAGYDVMSFRLNTKAGAFEAFYAVTAADGYELASYTRIAP